MGEESFKWKSDEQHIVWIESWLNQYPWLVAGMTTRIGGHSKAPYHSFNGALHVGDKLEDVLQNRKMLLNSLQISMDQWVSANQVHSNCVYYVDKCDAGRGSQSLETAIGHVDALYTDQQGILLATFYADCVPIFVVDPVKRIVGLAHAGWKGTVAEIGSALIHKLEERFNTNPNDIRIAIGPAIGGCCYEVNDQVIKHIKPFQHYLPNHTVCEKADGKYDLDLKLVNKHLLIKAGIPEENIEVSRWCTSCHNHLFFSHRKEMGKAGRMIAFIMLK